MQAERGDAARGQARDDACRDAQRQLHPASAVGDAACFDEDAVVGAQVRLSVARRLLAATAAAERLVAGGAQRTSTLRRAIQCLPLRWPCERIWREPSNPTPVGTRYVQSDHSDRAHRQAGGSGSDGLCAVSVMVSVGVGVGERNKATCPRACLNRDHVTHF